MIPDRCTGRVASDGLSMLASAFLAKPRLPPTVPPSDWCLFQGGTNGRSSAAGPGYLPKRVRSVERSSELADPLGVLRSGTMYQLPHQWAIRVEITRHFRKVAFSLQAKLSTNPSRQLSYTWKKEGVEEVGGQSLCSIVQYECDSATRNKNQEPLESQQGRSCVWECRPSTVAPLVGKRKASLFVAVLGSACCNRRCVGLCSWSWW
ncbi:hypothetical protein QBC43DRAFT_336271 [Cladorrhinum sp. PSN259]|nr:hypothetical protein QBC43DRAFT_336271 [Cladorrhinum sp. PSN259]